MEGKNSIRSARLENFLSFGSEGEIMELRPLNVLIGPNASGKSNLIEAFRFLSAVPRDPARIIREGGGASEFLYKGGKAKPTAKIEVVISAADEKSNLRYQIAFTEAGQRFQMVEEMITTEYPDHTDEVYRYPFGSSTQGQLVVYGTSIAMESGQITSRSNLIKQSVPVDANRSVLSVIKDPVRYPYLSDLDSSFSGIQCYAGWPLDRYGPIKNPQKVDLPTDVLWEDGSNLGLIFNNLPPKTKQEIIERLKLVYESVEDIQPKIVGSTIQLFLYEKDLQHPVPATRISDGTLRYLCLLTLLLHPTPPPLICIEEPEIGMHPDVIHTVAELLVEASQHTQIIVTTHSEQLVSALSDMPEAVVICERDQDGTHLQRLDAESLKEWLEDYSLGDLWRKGELGGTRW